MSAVLPVERIRALPVAPALCEQIPAGRITELSSARAQGRFTAAVSIVMRAQAEGEPIVWIQPKGGSLFPPDLHEAGVDLGGLTVVHIPPAAGARGRVRAAELVLRSGAFGAVVVDLTDGLPRSSAWSGRLHGLAHQHACRVVVLTSTDESRGSAGPLVGVRLQPTRDRRGPGRFAVSARVLRDKSGLGVTPMEEVRRGPWGAA
jgi:recombination protein RecA